MATHFQLVIDCAEPERLASLGASVIGALSGEATGHHAMAMRDPEGNESGIN